MYDEEVTFNTKTQFDLPRSFYMVHNLRFTVYDISPQAET